MSYTFNIDTVTAQFLDFMRSVNCQPVDDIQLQFDGHIHRYRVSGDRLSEKSGAYCVWLDYWPAGWVQNWRNGQAVTWKFERDSLDDEGKAHFNDDVYKKAFKLSQELQAKRREELLREQLSASDRARAVYETLKPAPEDHPYLQKKNIRRLSLHYKSDTHDLAVPLYDIQGRFMSIQWIDPNGDKQFFPHAPVSGAFFPIALDTADTHTDEPILICEGFATLSTIHELTGFPVVAAMSCNNLLRVAKQIKERYPKHRIIFMADNDHNSQSNSGLTHAQEANRVLQLNGVVFPNFSKEEKGTDWNDYLALHGEAQTARELFRRIHVCCLPVHTQKLLEHVKLVNAQELRELQLPPLKWAIDGFLPVGCSILAGSPKVGKSILALHIALSVAIGGCALGKINVQKGQVLYLALEDNMRRLQDRIISSSIDDDEDISNLDIVYDLPRQHEGGLDFINYWLDFHDNARLIIIDTLQKFRRQLTGKGSMYSEDYDAVGEIKSIADNRNIPILIIHHLKKAKEADDWLNEMSGSQGDVESFTMPE